LYPFTRKKYHLVTVFCHSVDKIRQLCYNTFSLVVRRKAMAQETIERQFTVTGPAMLRVSNINGLVAIQPGEDGVIAITAVKHEDRGDAERTEIDISQEADGSVRVKTQFHKRWEWIFDWRSPCRVDYTIRVPRACAVKVRGVTCDMSIQGLEGEINVRTVSGDVKLADLTGRLSARGVSGKIQGTGLEGPLEAETVSGDITLIGSSFPSVEATSVSGALAVEALTGSGPYRFKSVSGQLQVALPAGSGCKVEMSSVSGRLHSDLPITKEWGDGRQRGAEIQGGGPALHFKSVSGDMRVKPGAGQAAPAPAPAMASEIPAPPAPPAAPAPPAPPAAPPTPSTPPPAPPAESATNSRREILDRVAQGEITAAQGAEELRRLWQG
jgi:hypothetical protein